MLCQDKMPRCAVRMRVNSKFFANAAADICLNKNNFACGVLGSVIGKNDVIGKTPIVIFFNTSVTDQKKFSGIVIATNNYDSNIKFTHNILIFKRKKQSSRIFCFSSSKKNTLVSKPRCFFRVCRLFFVGSRGVIANQLTGQMSGIRLDFVFNLKGNVRMVTQE